MSFHYIMLITVQPQLAVFCALTLAATKTKYRLQKSAFTPAITYVLATDSEHDSVEKINHYWKGHRTSKGRH